MLFNKKISEKRSDSNFQDKKKKQKKLEVLFLSRQQLQLGYALYWKIIFKLSTVSWAYGLPYK